MITKTKEITHFLKGWNLDEVGGVIGAIEKGAKLQ